MIITVGTPIILANVASRKCVGWSSRCSVLGDSSRKCASWENAEYYQIIVIRTEEGLE